ncbi:MAG: micrococcal nuclease [Gaiellales bacterium]|jgi:endonuclease YncB( thermonuclease family)|nr:micrococcal nuclease [Gaiellales bacterium]
MLTACGRAAFGEYGGCDCSVRNRLPIVTLLAFLLTTPAAFGATRAGIIDHVADGDTVVLAGGETVRLVQIDTPEVYGDTECYGRQASALTESILPQGTRVRIATDPKLDQRDRDGRTLAYVWKGSSLVNLRLVRQGAAAPYFYSGDKGEYAAQLFKAAVAARKAGTGLWGHCRKGSVPLRAMRGVSTGPVNAAPKRTVAGGSSPGCNPNYTPCVPNSKADLDCRDVRHPVRVVGSDPYNLDSDGDGNGCESY